MRKHIIMSIAGYLAVNISLAQTCGSTNLAAGRPVTATAAQSYEAGDKLVDGNNGTYFWPSTRNVDQTAYVQLASSVTVCRVVVKWLEYHQGAFKIQVTNSNPSGGGVTWTDIATITSNNSPSVAGGIATNDLSIPNNYGTNQYVRLVLLAPLGNVQPVDLQVYASLSNVHPTVSITGPANNATYREGNTVMLAANAADSDGSIKKVEFYHDGIKLGEDTAAPYRYYWPNIATGNYTIKAVAYDNQNDTTHSANINFVVNANGWGLTGNTGILPDSQFLGTTDNSALVIRTGNTERARVDTNGVLLVNTTELQQGTDESVKLAVKGTILTKKLTVTQLNWADYVFEKSYKLMPLKDVQSFIDKNGHLPGVPSTEVIQQKGLDVGNGQAMLLQKIEELTLYILQQQKEIDQLKKQLKKK
jgi:hypothetical protein